MGFSRQEYWSGLPFPPPPHLPDPGIEFTSPALAGRYFTTWEALLVNIPSLKASLREEMQPYDASIYVLPGCKVWVREAGSSNQPTGFRFPQASVYHPP